MPAKKLVSSGAGECTKTLERGYTAKLRNCDYTGECKKTLTGRENTNKQANVDSGKCLKITEVEVHAVGAAGALLEKQL
jgi:hypothetical protein